MNKISAENLLVIPEYTTSEKLKLVFRPDRTEIILFILAFILNYIVLAVLISKEVFVGSVNSMNTSVFGVLLMSMYTLRWGHLSLDDYQRKAERMIEAHIKGEMIVPTIKFPGLIVSSIFMFGGLYFFKYLYFVLNPTLGPILKLLSFLLNLL